MTFITKMPSSDYSKNGWPFLNWENTYNEKYVIFNIVHAYMLPFVNASLDNGSSNFQLVYFWNLDHIRNSMKASLLGTL